MSKWSRYKFTDNSGVCIKENDYGDLECDYYGVLDGITKLELTEQSWKNTCFTQMWMV